MSSAKYVWLNPYVTVSHNVLTLLLTPFLRDHNVSLRATDVEEDLTQILRICIFTDENHTPKGNAYAKAPVCRWAGDKHMITKTPKQRKQRITSIYLLAAVGKWKVGLREPYAELTRTLRHQTLTKRSLACYDMLWWVWLKKGLIQSGKHKQAQCTHLKHSAHKCQFPRVSKLSWSIQFLSWQVCAKNLLMKTQPYGKLTQHACLTTPLRNLTLFRFLLTPKFHMTRPLLSSSWEVSCGAQFEKLV